MFSGLIQTTSQVTENKGRRLAVQSGGLTTKLGDSVAVNGICLTVTQTGAVLEFDVSPETLAKTTLKDLGTGTLVNLELALRMGDTLGGHIVQGHVDGVGTVREIHPEKDMKTIVFEAPESIMQYVVPKGSVTVDGVSLTAVDVTPNSFSVALVPYTLAHTNLDKLSAGTRVNLEADILGKYVAEYLKRK